MLLMLAHFTAAATESIRSVLCAGHGCSCVVGTSANYLRLFLHFHCCCSLPSPGIQMYVSLTAPSCSIPKNSITYSCSTTVIVADRVGKGNLLQGVSVTLRWATLNVTTVGFPANSTQLTAKGGTARFTTSMPPSASGCTAQVTAAVLEGYWVNGLPGAVTTTFKF
jgi:hypothetical protein